MHDALVVRGQDLGFAVEVGQALGAPASEWG
jgi:hypothetical protein